MLCHPSRNGPLVISLTPSARYCGAGGAAAIVDSKIFCELEVAPKYRASERREWVGIVRGQGHTSSALGDRLGLHEDGKKRPAMYFDLCTMR